MMDLTNNKRVMRKLITHNNHIRKTGTPGTLPRTLFINPSNVCNFSCEQCYASSQSGSQKAAISTDRLRTLALEADELGIYEILIEGGEPLVFPNLFDIIDAFGSERFYLAITTNGYLLDDDMAERLAKAGISRVSVSLDSLDAAVHDNFRCKPGSFERAISALESIKRANMQSSVNYLIGHHNIQTDELEKMCEFCQENHYQLMLISAAPVGNWKGNLDIMLDENDTERLNLIRRKYKNVWRCLWPAIERGNEDVCSCAAVNKAYINPNGDVLPCPYIHIKIGNIYEQSLRDILSYGFSIKCFSEDCEKCLSAEDRDFAEKYLQHKEMSIMTPIPASKCFGEVN